MQRGVLIALFPLASARRSRRSRSSLGSQSDRRARFAASPRRLREETLPYKQQLLRTSVHAHAASVHDADSAAWQGHSERRGEQDKEL